MIVRRTELNPKLVLRHRVREVLFGIGVLGRGLVELDEEKQFDVFVVEKIKIHEVGRDRVPEVWIKAFWKRQGSLAHGMLSAPGYGTPNLPDHSACASLHRCAITSDFPILPPAVSE